MKTQSKKNQKHVRSGGVFDLVVEDSFEHEGKEQKDSDSDLNGGLFNLVVEDSFEHVDTEQKGNDSDLNGGLFDLVVEDSFVHEDRRVHSFDLNQLPEEEEVESKIMAIVDSATETISVRKHGRHFDLNRFLDDECGEDNDTKKERKRFIRSMLKLYFLDFY